MTSGGQIVHTHSSRHRQSSRVVKPGTFTNYGVGGPAGRRGDGDVTEHRQAGGAGRCVDES